MNPSNPGTSAVEVCQWAYKDLLEKTRQESLVQEEKMDEEYRKVIKEASC